MHVFNDFVGKRVYFSFDPHAFGEEPKHVWVLTRYKQNWVVTDHKKRGLEFPGGKKEQGESLDQAAKREISEELGAEAGPLHYIGQYRVDDSPPFVKAVYFTQIVKLSPKTHYYETNGPQMITGNLMEMRMQKEFSFLMKDDVLEHALHYWKNNLSRKD
ncbi:RNA deprotection pyrophosphohydrolase [Jeotgalibacillus proteolyticus]|uniref:Nucleoside triphosphatase YtkD n=1 Tax=Jeotgalibacillus proteolyticus TaxID=2082395 RepID=A0A2S5GFT4_9BACL|nr:nucleoside triphosphatase YtkD [Jeotgalibacillus proteolyticus]PPA71743.1 nucleoside triphosphatase YtkD [Jeotgalibacillus proteolyticus]